MLKRTKEILTTPIAPKDALAEGGNILKATAVGCMKQPLEIADSVREAFRQPFTPKGVLNFLTLPTRGVMKAAILPYKECYGATRDACDRLFKKS